MTEILIVSLISLLFFYLSNIIAKKFNLLDFPNKRKIHLYPTPYTGGIGLILSFFFIIWILYFDNVLLKIIFASFFIFIIGLIDDKYNINPGSRILFQFLTIFFFIDTFNLEITYIFNLDELFILELGGFSLIFTIFSVAFLINAFNYSDGIDGLLTTQTIFILLSLVFFQFYYYKSLNVDLLYLIIPLSLFLLFNFKFYTLPKLFLGNGGSAMLGFIISFLFIYFGYYADLNIDPELMIWGLSFIVFEFLSTNLSRLSRNNLLFKPGNDHIHFILLKKFKSALIVNLIILSVSLFFLIIGFFSFLFGDVLSLVIFILSFFVYFFYRERLLKISKKNKLNF